MSTRLWAAVAVGVGLLIGQIGGRLVRSSVGRERRDENTRARALALSRGIFWGSTAVGLAIAAGILDREGFEHYLDLVRDGLPRVLMGWCSRSPDTRSPCSWPRPWGRRPARRPACARSQWSAIKISILAIAVVIGLVVAGVDHTMLVVVLVALVGAPALTLSLLTARGAAPVATQVAPGGRCAIASRRAGTSRSAS
ncbi:MAG: hypothetical protein R2716_04275 [Microthrixaceae bacterium]